MAGSKTAYLSKALLDHVLGRTAYTAPATLYAAISTAPFDPNATGTSMSEVDTGAAPSYARLAIANDVAHWPNASLDAPAVKSNAEDLIWATAGESWGVPLSVYLCDALTGGNALYGCDVNSADEIAGGGTFKLLEGTFVFSED